MANNYTILDSNGNPITKAALDIGGVHHTKVILYDATGAAIDFVAPVAHDAADAGAPLKIGAKATTSISGQTKVVNNDRTNLLAGVDGVLVTRPHANLEDYVNSGEITCTSGASTSALAAAGSGLKYYITSVIIVTGGSTAGYVRLLDGSGGTSKARIPFGTKGGVFNPPIPISGFTANTAIFADPDVSDTVVVTLLGFKSAV